MSDYLSISVIICYVTMYNLILFLFPAELKMDVIREREVKDSLERQLVDERKLRSKLKILKYIKQQQLCSAKDPSRSMKLFYFYS